MSGKKIFTCDCGFQWNQGANGGHSCTNFYIVARGKLNDRITELESKLEGDKWISIEVESPINEYTYDVWIKSKEKDSYGRRIAGVSYYNDEFNTGFHQQPVEYPEYISHWKSIPSPPGE